MNTTQPPAYWRQFTGLFVAGVLLVLAPTPWQITGIGIFWMVLPVLAGIMWIAKQRTGQSSSALIAKWTKKNRKDGGVASRWDHWRVASKHAMRRQATVLRPSFAQLSWWQRYRTPVTAYATQLAKVARRGFWSSCEAVTLRVGGPRTGKTGELAGRIVDGPGAVIATSTRKDLIGLTAPIRSKIGPIHIFNPAGIGSIASTVKWSPLAGCRDLSTAQRRASDMIPPANSEEAERWDAQARRVLGVLLHAAAVAGLPMRAVLKWAASPEDPKSQQRVDDALTTLPDTPETRSVRASARQFFELNERTQTSITTTMMPALQWLTDAKAAAIGDADANDGGLFDVREFIDHKGTLYMLGAKDGTTAPLTAALTAEIAHTARMLAEDLPGGRLDPPLTLALDEAALICPVPLDEWTADMGGRGITLHISLQSRSQLRQRWGPDGAATILNNSSAIMIFGGQRDPDDLQAWSSLSGERDEDATTRDDSGDVTAVSDRKVPVLSAAQIANLPPGQVLIINRGMPASIGTAVMAWKRRDVRKAQKTSPWEPTRETHYAEQAARDAMSLGTDMAGSTRAVPMPPATTREDDQTR